MGGADTFLARRNLKKTCSKILSRFVRDELKNFLEF